jgi:hypothetical protein
MSYLNFPNIKVCAHTIHQRKILFKMLNFAVNHLRHICCTFLPCRGLMLHPRRYTKCLKNCSGIPKKDGGNDCRVLHQDTVLRSAYMNWDKLHKTFKPFGLYHRVVRKGHDILEEHFNMFICNTGLFPDVALQPRRLYSS